MPRETTRQSARQEAGGSHTEIEIKQTDRAVWVALSGILDRDGVERLIAQVSPRLGRRGCRVVLDGRRLFHLDYRSTSFLVAWNRKLRTFHHELYLHGWNEYLKAILVMEDWDRELGASPQVIANWRHLSDTPRRSMP